MEKVLIISGHPSLETSVANKQILEELETKFDSMRLRRLDQLGYDFDVAKEQEELSAADVIVLQFPNYWYSVPAIMKNYLDRVLTYGFAYGTGGDKLKGKKFFLSSTTGGAEDSYGPEGYNNFSVAELYHHLEQTINLVQGVFCGITTNHDSLYVPGMTPEEKKAEIQSNAKVTAQKLFEKIKSA